MRYGKRVYIVEWTKALMYAIIRPDKCIECPVQGLNLSIGARFDLAWRLSCVRIALECCDGDAVLIETFARCGEYRSDEAKKGEKPECTSCT